MAEVTLTLDQFVGKVDALPAELEQALIRALRSTAMRGVGVVVQEISEAEPHPAVNFGHLRQSVTWLRLPNGAEIIVDAPHAPFLEFGTRAHFPPLEPLILWAYRKGLADTEEEAEEVAFLVARKIAQTGIAPRHFFAKAMVRIERDVLPGEVEYELERL